jgi:hypothetical protein
MFQRQATSIYETNMMTRVAVPGQLYCNIISDVGPSWNFEYNREPRNGSVSVLNVASTSHWRRLVDARQPERGSRRRDLILDTTMNYETFSLGESRHMVAFLSLNINGARWPTSESPRHQQATANTLCKYLCRYEGRSHWGGGKTKNPELDATAECTFNGERLFDRLESLMTFPALLLGGVGSEIDFIAGNSLTATWSTSLQISQTAYDRRPAGNDMNLYPRALFGRSL